jgi:vacuolar-type H+-ATPase subunit I/STV1
MKKMIMIAVVGLVLFGASFAGSYFLFGKPEPEPTELAEGEEAGEHGSPEHAKAVADGHGEADHGTHKADNKPETLPVAFRPNEPLSVEAVLQLAGSIRDKEKVVGERMQIVEKQEERIKLLFEDLNRERTELTSMNERVEQQIARSEELLTRLKSEREILTKQKEELEAKQPTAPKKVPLDDPEAEQTFANVASWFEKMNPEQAAANLKQMANDGQMELAANLLGRLEDRKIAEILEQIADPKLVTDIVNIVTKQTAPATEK